MGLSAEEYTIKCDVKGCGALSVGKIPYLSREGWMARMIYDGKPTLVELVDNVKVCICSTCCREGFYKTMSYPDG